MIDHFIIIRFSISLDKVKINFTDEYMDKRFFLFEKLTLLSLKAQSLKDFKCIILIDNNLKDKYYSKLKNLVHSLDYIIIHKLKEDETINNTNYLNKYRNPKSKYLIQTRLDDDDIIHRDINLVFKNTINKHIEKYLNTFISFRGGKYINYNGSEWRICRNTRDRMAIFFSLITEYSNNESIFNTNHEKATNLKKIKMRNCWGVCNHDIGLSRRYQRFTFQDRPIDYERLKTVFNL
ncbi:MAG: hypothetical protein CMF62_00855 [Magnetococcales bacterium]|nr:hypothetical protein [Magnetococcales bacterium]|tara:strand:+ start:324 stop:1031 length:708 start_codon:yes stop_codon:yes gene_type:complete